MSNVVFPVAPFPIIETERLRLREVRADDASAMFAVLGDPLVTRYFGMHPQQSDQDSLKRIEGIFEAYRAGEGIRWAIADLASDRLIGSGGFWRLIDEHHRAEIGYELGQEHWGKGLMAEALKAIINFGFNQMRLHSIEAQIHPANGASRRLLEKIGFVQEGYFRENYFDVVENNFTDTAVFSLLAKNWPVREAGG